MQNYLQNQKSFILRIQLEKQLEFSGNRDFFVGIIFPSFDT